MTSKMVRKRAAQIREAVLKRRRKQWLLVAGAVIVAATFLVKDVFRDRLKELSASISTAERIESEDEARQVLLEEQNTLALAQRTMQDQGKLQKPPSKLTLQMDANLLWQSYSEVSENVENISSLLDKLPQRGEYARYLRGERDDMRQDLAKKLIEIQKSVKEKTPSRWAFEDTSK
jgi:hypothetical protein